VDVGANTTIYSSGDPSGWGVMGSLSVGVFNVDLFRSGGGTSVEIGVKAPPGFGASITGGYKW
jgi:hypothetical protein